ncbi:hypothetical protein E2C01_039073 [Portunus trituberculatus]|uniref:Uncharacterized protein n=1 Tax=Portunus trituberculatus TaxID=210409 RepID=A0A5B7FIN4_PORTR|nr:hypothetical protein [Portunus trituberculatus]
MREVVTHHVYHPACVEIKGALGAADVPVRPRRIGHVRLQHVESCIAVETKTQARHACGRKVGRQERIAPCCQASPGKQRTPI